MTFERYIHNVFHFFRHSSDPFENEFFSPFVSCIRELFFKRTYVVRERLTSLSRRCNSELVAKSRLTYLLQAKCKHDRSFVSLVSPLFVIENDDRFVVLSCRAYGRRRRYAIICKLLFFRTKRLKFELATNKRLRETFRVEINPRYFERDVCKV